jgi:hypothetical protein
VLLPETLAVPTLVPPVVQVVGALVSGPKTVKVIVPRALEPDEAPKLELIEPVLIVVPAVPVPGPLAVRLGLVFATVVSVMPEPQVLTAALLFASPL